MAKIKQWEPKLRKAVSNVKVGKTILVEFKRKSRAGIEYTKTEFATPEQPKGKNRHERRREVALERKNK